MWLWQQNGRKQTTFSRIIGISTAAHLVALCAFFIMYRGGAGAFSISVGKNIDRARVVLMPLYKIMPAALQPGVSAGGQPAQALQAQKKIEEKKEIAPAKKEPTTFVSHKVTVSKRGKKNKAKKQIPVKKKQKKNVQKKAKLEPKKIEKLDPIKAEPPKIVQETKQEITQPISPTSALAQAVPNDAIYVGQLEYDALKLQDALQGEVERCWQSPPGLQDISCEIKVVLDFNGKPHAIDIQNSSGVLMYDLSARGAVQSIAFPNFAWGKEITITFTC